MYAVFFPTPAPQRVQSPVQVQSLAFFMPYSDFFRFILSSYSDVPHITSMTTSTAIITMPTHLIESALISA